MGKEKDPTLDALKKAAKGLTYTSETDAPLEPFAWEGGGRLTAGRVRELAGADRGAAVEQVSLADFFGAVPDEDREKFQDLARALQEQLSGVKVYKLGSEPEKAVYVVGKAPDGRLMGLKTTVVET